MKRWLIITLCIGIVMLLSAGCTGINGFGSEEQDSRNLPPPQKMVEVQIEKDPIDQFITITFAGGEGQHLVHRIWAEVKRSDGIRSEADLKPDKLAYITIPGTRGSDTVVVKVLYSDGTQYIIADEDIKIKERMSRL